MPVVLLPGMLCDARLWRHQVAALSGTATVQAGSVAGAITVNALAQTLLSLCPQRFALGGFSMGGIVALEMLRIAPERIAGLALVDTNCWADTAERAAMREAQVELVRGGGLCGLVREQLMPNYLADVNAENPGLQQEIESMAMSAGALTFVQQALALGTRADSLELLQKFKGPSLVLCGAEDKLCPPEGHREMAAALEDSSLHIIDGAGHFAPLERPAIVNSAMLDWVRQVQQKESEQ